MDSSNIENFINEDLLREFLVQIDDGYSQFQRKQLEIVSLIAEIGADIAVLFEQNRFFQIFSKSGLLKRIEEILQSEIKIEEEKKKRKKNQQSSEFIITLVQTISFIYKNCRMDNLQLLKDCGLEIVNHFIQLPINILEQEEDENNFSSFRKDRKKEEQMENEIQERVRTLKGFRYMIEDGITQAFLVYPHSLVKELMELFHLECFSSYECKHCLFIGQSATTHDILAAVYGIFAEILWDVDPEEVTEGGIDIEHLAPIILSFAGSIPNKYGANISNQQLYHILPSSSSSHQSISSLSFTPNIEIELAPSRKLVANALQLIYFLICEIEIDIIKLPRMWVLQNAFVALTTNQFKSENETELFKILDDSMSVCGGNEEDNDQVVQSALSKIGFLIGDIQRDKHQNQYLHKISKEINEELIDVGADEEKDALLFKLDNSQKEEWSNSALQTKKAIFNVKKDQTNGNDNRW
ncbi:MAG: hypothetical protein EZS28_020858 [Streblomastix strix]|uniref:Uncharacterized protein n=1 Tax=Streblomastix strix TaxID=222440 RepID=A0A5J4VME1_9EUKA|nr:MAG: hypothetical protein EZS28_020858 [Streblomastix strix]